MANSIAGFYKNRRGNDIKQTLDIVEVTEDEFLNGQNTDDEVLLDKTIGDCININVDFKATKHSLIGGRPFRAFQVKFISIKDGLLIYRVVFPSLWMLERFYKNTIQILETRELCDDNLDELYELLEISNELYSAYEELDTFLPLEKYKAKQ